MVELRWIEWQQWVGSLAFPGTRPEHASMDDSLPRAEGYRIIPMDGQRAGTGAGTAVGRVDARRPDRREDVVQEVLLTVHRVRRTWDPRRPFSPWLATIAARRAIDLLRRRSRIERHEQHDELASETFADPAANNDDGEERSLADLAPFLEALPVRQREALEALKLRGQSLQEAARSSGQSVAALKVNMHRAVKSLRRLLGTENG
jgi:RNA polymerase sigma factor (sigma-70 family)